MTRPDRQAMPYVRAVRGSVFAVIVLTAAGCGAKFAPADDDKSAGDAAGASDTAPGTMPSTTPLGDATPADALPPEPPSDALPSDPAPAIDCSGGDVGPAVAGTFVSMAHQIAAPTLPCSGSDCVKFFGFDASCALSSQVKGIVRKATATTADCAILVRWMTSKRLVDALEDKVTCYGKDGPVAESTEVYLSTGSPRKKTSACTLEPFVSHRACIEKFRAKYFP